MEGTKEKRNLAASLTIKIKKMAKKTAKQEFLDKETTTNEDWVTQVLLTTTSKKKVAEIGRALRHIHTVAYKSWARDLPLEKVLEAVEKAFKLMQSEKAEKDADL